MLNSELCAAFNMMPLAHLWHYRFGHHLGEQGPCQVSRDQGNLMRSGLLDQDVHGLEMRTALLEC